MIDQSGQPFSPNVRQMLGGPGAALTFMGIVYGGVIGLVAIAVGAMSPTTRGVSVAALVGLGALMFGPLRFWAGGYVSRYLSSSGRAPR